MFLKLSIKAAVVVWTKLVMAMKTENVHARHGIDIINWLTPGWNWKIHLVLLLLLHIIKEMSSIATNGMSHSICSKTIFPKFSDIDITIAVDSLVIWSQLKSNKVFIILWSWIFNGSEVNLKRNQRTSLS